MNDFDLTRYMDVRGELPAPAEKALQRLLGQAAALRKLAEAGLMTDADWAKTAATVAEMVEGLLLVLPVADICRALTFVLLHEGGCPIYVGAWTEQQTNERAPK